MKNLIKCLGLAVGVAVLFIARPAAANVTVYFNPPDRIYQDRYILQTPDTPIIYQGVIYYPNAALTNMTMNTEPPGTVAPRIAVTSPGASYIIYNGNAYQTVPPRR